MGIIWVLNNTIGYDPGTVHIYSGIIWVLLSTIHIHWSFVWVLVGYRILHQGIERVLYIYIGVLYGYCYNIHRVLHGYDLGMIWV